MRIKVNKCPACGSKPLPHLYAGRPRCQDADCNFTCELEVWNYLSLAVQAARDTYVVDSHGSKRSLAWERDWIRMRKSKLAFADECERRNKC
jgi:hypothetical protein